MENPFIQQLNDFYHDLNLHWIDLYTALNHRVFSLKSEYSEKHSCFDDAGERISSDYPLPLIEVEGICEFQVGPDHLSCFSKIQKQAVSVLDSQSFHTFPFDLWGEDDYYTLLYRTSRDSISVSAATAASDERRFVVHFRLPVHMEADKIYLFAKLLRKSGFFI